MKIYLARHGQTDWNLAHKAQGQTDIPLNQTGKSQALALRQVLESYNFDVCYCSPLKRAAQTAEIALNGKLRIIFDDMLKERSFGQLEGTDPSTWDFDDYDCKLNIDIHNIEPINSLLDRAQKFLNFLKSHHSDQAKILLIGHGTFFKALHFIIIGYDDTTDFNSFHLKNGEISIYDI